MRKEHKRGKFSFGTEVINFVSDGTRIWKNKHRGYHISTFLLFIPNSGSTNSFFSGTNNFFSETNSFFSGTNNFFSETNN
jgi:hypothetical protein